MPRALVVFFALALLENGSAEHCIPDPNLICGTCGDRMYIAAIGGSSGATSGSAADWGVWLEDPGPSMCLALPKDDVEQDRPGYRTDGRNAPPQRGPTHDWTRARCHTGHDAEGLQREHLAQGGPACETGLARVG